MFLLILIAPPQHRNAFKTLKTNNYDLTKMPRPDDAFNKITCVFINRYTIENIFSRIFFQKNTKYLQYSAIT
jgi:hypothetical protein